MKSWKKTLLSVSPSAMCVLLSGCLFGENKTFFDYKTGTNGAGGTDPNTATDPLHSNVTSTGTSTGTTTGTSTAVVTATGIFTGTGTLTGTGTSTLTATSTATPSPTPGYGFCCNVQSGVTVPASATGCDHGVALFPIAAGAQCLAAIPTPTPAHVCDPFEPGGTAGSNQNGIKAKLYYYTAQELRDHPFHGVNDFIRYGTSPNVDFFFTNFFTPTRAFDRGFVLNDGSVLSNEQGTPLYENFAFKFTGGIQLPQGMAGRHMQFAILSDDGATFSIVNPRSSSVILNNDGNHPTRMACANAPVTVSSTERLKFELDYYQGPRYHISLVLLWREWSDNSGFDPNDQWCGQSGNNLFFDSSTNPSTPQSPWNDLMNRWEVVPGNVFHVDGDTEVTNPCH